MEFEMEISLVKGVNQQDFGKLKTPVCMSRKWSLLWLLYPHPGILPWTLVVFSRFAVGNSALTNCLGCGKRVCAFV